MIPKIIHYCWFGGKSLPELAVKCIESWKRFCPDYEIIRWDESNFDINVCPYAREAYDAKKFAFVSDYARLKVLVEHGGIYMDTDMEVLKSLDKFLSNKAFAGLESEDAISCGIMACEKGFTPFADIKADYHNRHFIHESNLGNSYDYTTIVKTVTCYFSRYGFKFGGLKQTIKGYTIYPKDYFYPKSYATLKIEITENTCTIHHFAASWTSPWAKFKQKVKRLLGVGITSKIVAAKNFFRRLSGE